MRKQPRDKAKTTRTTLGFLILSARGGGQIAEPTPAGVPARKGLFVLVYFITDKSRDVPR